MSHNIILCGVGGQGTILASKLISKASMDNEISVRTCETIGMAQRGGSVFSCVKLGGNRLSPLIKKGTADLIIGFEPAESLRMLPYLKEGGAVVSSISPQIPTTSSLSGGNYDISSILLALKNDKRVGKLVLIDTNKAINDLGSGRIVNMVLLGAASRVGLINGLSYEDIKNSMISKVKPQFVDMNLKALEYYKI